MAIKLALEEGLNVTPIYFDTGSAHPDNLRFKLHCEQWYGRQIITFKNSKYSSVLDLVKKRRLFPLIERKMSKANCLYELEVAEIEKPAMYKLGYHNNNCIGCVKGGLGYWNKIRSDFPEVFKATAQAEREIGRSCNKGTFLDELEPGRGRYPEELAPECGIFCPTEDFSG